MRKRLCAHYRVRGISLIEILSVLALVAIVLVLLWPVFGRVREAGRSAACVHNLRQIGGALIAYVSDHQGVLIPAASLGGSPQRFWFDELDFYMGGDREVDDSRDAPLAWQRCPSKPVVPLNRQVVGYGWNHSFFGYTLAKADVGYGPFSKLVEVSKPSRTIIIADSIDVPPDGPLPGASQHRYLYRTNIDRLARRHSGRGNYLMLDGHVETFIPEKLVAGYPGADAALWYKRQ